MPTPKYTPGAQLIPLTFGAPGFFGLNTEQSATILGKEWATVLNNAVFDQAGRPAARKGWTTLTGTPGVGIVRRIFEYFKADGTSSVIFSTDGDILNDTSTPTSIDGSLTITEGNIKFVNFNDKCIAFGIGAAGVPAVKTTGNFASITVNSGTAPTSMIGTAAFGRLWGVMADGKTIKYSSLLDETRWATDGSGDGGSIDMSQVWPSGQDAITAIEEFMGDLIIFGKNNIVIWTDGQGASLGIDPLMMYVSDTIPGLGALTQFGICRATGDLWVLTPTGIVSLGRELQQRSTPYNNVSKNVQSTVIELVQSATDIDDITLEYSPRHAMVVCCFPDSDTHVVFDTRSPMQDGSYRATTWTSTLQTLAYIRAADTLYGSLTNVVGEVMDYSGFDDDGTSFIWEYNSGWLDLGEQLNVYLKFVKRMTSFVLVEQNVQVTHNVEYDFGLREYSVAKSATGGRQIEWGQFEWGANGVYDVDDAEAVAGVDYAEWAAGVLLRTLDANPGGAGQYIKVGISLNTESGDFALQQINLYAKVGRIAT